MNKIYLILSIPLLFFKGYSQDGFISFDNSSNLFRIKIDTSNHGNIWQIGKPDKLYFYSAYSTPNDIITDSIHPYPINNNSIFLLGAVIPFSPFGADVTILDFYYKMDADTINDYGKIEFSADTGKTYYNLIDHSMYSVYDSAGNLIANNASGNPILFTGKSYGWYHGTFNTWGLPYPDTLIYRFTFHSHGNQNNRDGWMIDNIGWQTFWEGIPGKYSNCKLFPNPAKDFLQIDSKTKIKEISVISELGQNIFTKSINDMSAFLNLKYLENGIYFLKIVCVEQKVIMKRFIKQP